MAMFIQLYGCTTWTLTKHIEKKFDRNCTRMQWAVMNKSWKRHPTKQQLYSHLPPISKPIQVWQTRHTELCWRSKDKLISNVLLRTPSHRWVSVGPPARTYLQLLCVHTRCSLEDLLETMDVRDKWWERVWKIHARGTAWWCMTCTP